MFHTKQTSSVPLFSGQSSSHQQSLCQRYVLSRRTEGFRRDAPKTSKNLIVLGLHVHFLEPGIDKRGYIGGTELNDELQQQAKQQ